MHLSDTNTISFKHTNEFSKRASSYENYNIIQQKVVKKLLSKVITKDKQILDLGCGSGAVYKAIGEGFKTFTGIDKANKMCILHPKRPNIRIMNQDFENFFFNQNKYFDLTISSSALQWAMNIENLFDQIHKNSKEIALSIFCDGTFKTIYQTSNLQTFLPSSKAIIKQLNKYFNFEFEIVNYKLSFKDNLSKFRYIKKSGVSGGERKLDYISTKKLIKEYPLDYLEFEVLFVWGESKRDFSIL